MDLSQLFAEVARAEAADLHLIANYPPSLRTNGKIVPLSNMPPLTPADMEQLVFSSLSPTQKELFLSNKEIDYSISSPNGRFRANIYYQRGTIAADFRLIPSTIRTIDQLALPQICHQLITLRQGLVLVTGPTGHGKSTSLAAMINQINMARASHIVTIEDPIEYVYPKGQSIVSQREMHEDTHSWSVALRSVLREDPDVVLVGEMRDYETIAAALTVAETGHLVFATLHTNSASQTIDRIVDVFPENQQPQIRLQLSLVLEAVISQRLIPTIAGGRVAVAEVLTGTPAVKTTIREGKTHLLDNVIQTSAEMGMITLETALAEVVKKGQVSAEMATSYAMRPQDLGRLLQGVVQQ